jgi:glucosylceramidase
MRSFLILSLGAAGAAQPKAKWVSSTEQHPWVQQRDIDGQDPGALPSRLTMTDDRFQSMMGFGACFKEVGWIALQSLSQQDREVVLRKFFAPDVLGVSYNRVRIGASDYGDGWYSHNEMDGDYSQSNFTVARDEGSLIPYIHAAQRYMKQGSDI